MIDVLASEGHFRDHLLPIWSALPEEHRGAFGPPYQRQDAVLVASYGDHKRARELGYTRIARMEHGAGQSYAGDPKSARVPNYAGGDDADDVGLFLVPGPHPAKRWGDRYPDARVGLVGCPKLDTLPRADGPSTTVALSFHFNAGVGCPEGDGAFRWYRDLLPVLARRFDLIGHAHPRHAERIRPWFRQVRVPFVETFAEVCQRAAVYVCDNSSTIFEFAATDRPVVLLNTPAYRRDVEHGLRFYEAAGVGIQARPSTVVEAIEQALVDAPEDQAARHRALELVYPSEVRSGAAARAAQLLVDWAA